MRGKGELLELSQARSDVHLRIHAVPVFVRDQDRSLRLFVEQLGFNLIVDSRFESKDGMIRWVAVAPPDGTAVLGLITPKPGSDEDRFIGGCPSVVFITDNIDSKYREWCARGVRFLEPPQTSEWGGTFAQFEDVDGNGFTLVSVDIISQQVEAQRRAIAERLESERRVAQEFAIARQVQTRLFPQRQPPLRTLDYGGMCVPARQVGGDYYDFLDLGCERLGLVIGDISGKGIAAALLMANLQANLRGQCAIASDRPQALLRSVNDLRPGGRWRFVNRHPQGEAGFHGEYREITPPSRIVFTEIFEDFPDTVSVVTAELADEDGKTRLTANVRYPSKDVRDMVIASGMSTGAGISYDRLEDLLAELQRS
jgi:uncharacterized protein YndB with AHSA1/START domain/catechol 2,3-dioxygenase-like lactoylglutathione lyase family enzyme